MSNSDADLRRRPRRNIPAIVCAVVLLILAILAIWAAVQQLSNGTWPIFVTAGLDILGRTAWASPAGWIAGAVVVVVGIVLLILAFAPGHYRSVTLAIPKSSDVRRQTAFLSTASLARLAAAQARQLDGVENVRTSVAGRRIRVRVATTLDDPSALSSRVRKVLDARFSAAGVSPAPRIRVSTSRRRDAG